MRVTFSDIKALDATGKFTVDLRAYYNHYPFGMIHPNDAQNNEKWEGANNENGYRFGYNGKEKDNELKGNGNSYDYGMRMFDPRVGRFLSIDPLRAKFPQLTPYQFASNTPIWATDLDGLEARIYNDVSFPIGHTFLSVLDKNGVINLYTYGQYGEGKNGGGNNLLV